ncbi:MAG: nodulation protein NfeD [Phycisphaerales bacterium]|nr:MAG: nodulation protein NfeD [Phycisphaerales bacterium]
MERPSPIPIALMAVLLVVLAGKAMPTEADSDKPPREGVGPVLWATWPDKAITPVTVRYFRRVLREAKVTRAQCLVLELDTPGGLVDSTRELVREILSTDTPVIVYVSPPGARAASAGVFITLSAHLAAMAPGTHIGAAHPVVLGGLPSLPEEPGPADPEADEEGSGRRLPGASGVMERKVVNDAQAWARSLAQLRGRNADWAAQAVSESRSITASEALEQRVIEVVATNATTLLEAAEEREVALPSGPLRLHTAGAVVQPLPMWWGERLLAVLSDPNVAFLLLILGFYGIVFEFYTPGWGVPGTLGVLCLILAFFGLSVLPINYAGLALIALALGLFVAEVFVASFGLLTLGGVICLVLGALMLIDSPVSTLRVSLNVAVPLALATAAITAFLISRALRGFKAPIQTGDEEIVGRPAQALVSFTGEAGRFCGQVWTHGELWQAFSSYPVAEGEKVRVQERQGLRLQVEPDMTSTHTGEMTTDKGDRQ